jgi:hypothetical protein
MRLKEIAEQADLGLILKIGGAESVTHMFDSQHIGVSGLVSPMIESAYAAKKYIQAIQKYFSKDLRKTIHFGVNIETIQGYNNLAEIFSLEDIHELTFVTVGRVDMTGSLGISKNDINSDQIYKITEDIFTQAKKKKFTTAMGGGIALESLPFIKKLAAKKLIDKFETRKVVFKVPKTFAKTEDAIIKANMFELLWLENKNNYYSGILAEDEPRLTMLRKRIGSEN